MVKSRSQGTSGMAPDHAEETKPKRHKGKTPRGEAVETNLYSRTPSEPASPPKLRSLWAKARREHRTFLTGLITREDDSGFLF